MTTIDNVKRVYSGVNGKCCCGCSGKYSDSDRSKKIILNKILKNPDHKYDNGHVYAVNGNRLLIAYFN